MKMEKTDLRLFQVLYLVVAGVIVTQILDMDELTSSLYFLTFPLTVVLWLRTVRKTVIGTDLLMIAVIVYAILSVLLDSSLTGAEVTFEYIKKPIIFSMTLLFFQTAHRIRAEKELVVFLNRLVDVLVVFFILMYFARFAQMHIFGERVTIYLTFRFSNPNLTSLFLICFYVMQVYRLFTPERWYKKVVHIVMAAFLALFVVETRSRNALLVLVIFTAVSAWLIFRGSRNMRIGALWATLAAVFPGLFVGAYVMLVYSPEVQKLLAFAVGEGKKLDSRMRVWGPALEILRESPLIGAYQNATVGLGRGHLHNTHLEVACCYGIPTLVGVCALLFCYLYQKSRVYTHKSNYLYMLGFACSIMLGIGEAALFSGGLAIYVFIGAFLLLANADRSALPK